MKKFEKVMLKRFAKEGLAENGIKLNMNKMILLECAMNMNDGRLYFHNNDEIRVSYVMVEDSTTGRQFQIYYGAKYYNHELDTLYCVDEYTEYTTEVETVEEMTEDAMLNMLEIGRNFSEISNKTVVAMGNGKIIKLTIETQEEEKYKKLGYWVVSIFEQGHRVSC